MVWENVILPRYPKMFLVNLLLCLTLPSTLAVPRLTRDLTVKFFTDVSMLCDHIELNVTDNPNVQSISWLFPDGSLRATNEDIANLTKFSFSGPDSAVTVAVADRSKFDAYNLSVRQVDEDEFGYYSCFVVFKDPSSSGSDIVAAIRWGLNVDGADYSELIDHYKESAVIGSIAAAAMLAVLGGGCLLWHFNYSKRHSEDELEKDRFEENGVVEMDDVAVVKKSAKVNDGFTPDYGFQETKTTGDAIESQ